MSTIKDIVRCFSYDLKEWSYYGSVNIDINSVLNDSEKALQFIEEYFKIGGKRHVFEFPQIKSNSNRIKERAIHIVSTFFLGLRIAEWLNIDTKKRNDQNMSFQYYWFLSCLYHDIGYVYELDSHCEQLRMISIDGLEAIQEVCDIKYLHNRVFRTCQKDIVDLYLKGRATCRNDKKGVIDHGIVGGLMLYDGLRKQFEYSWKHRVNKNDSRESFYINKNGCSLHCSNAHYEEYAKAADAIIAHNIWKDTLRMYLEEAGKSDYTHQKIRIENELCFILCLADTIEPYKKLSQRWDEVSFLFGDKSIIINIPKDITNHDYTKGIKGLKDWMDVTVATSGNQQTIRLNSRKE